MTAVVRATLILSDGSRFTETARIPAGALNQATGEPVARRKLDQGLGLTGADLRRRTQTAEALRGAPLERTVGSLLAELPSTGRGGS